MRKTILCYGDSNTFGYVPAGGGKRYPEDVCWTGVLQDDLGDAYRVIEEGCSGRTTDIYPPGTPWKNGRAFLYTALHSHKPLDMVILMLGTNDLKYGFHRDETMIAASVKQLVLDVRAYMNEKNEKMPKILIMAPAPLGRHVAEGCFGDDFNTRSYEVSLGLGNALRNIAEETGCLFLDLALYCTVSDADCVHLTAESHIEAGRRIAEVVRKALEN